MIQQIGAKCTAEKRNKAICCSQLVYIYHCKNILVTSTMFYLSQLHVCGVHIMKFNECFQTSLLKTLKSKHSEASLQSSFQKTYQLAFLALVWLHSYGRNAINVAQ